MITIGIEIEDTVTVHDLGQVAALEIVVLALVQNLGIGRGMHLICRFSIFDHNFS